MSLISSLVYGTPSTPLDLFMMANIDNLLSRLQHVRQKSSNQWVAQCPAHDDKTPSLSIKLGNSGKILIYDFGGCGALEVLESIGLSQHDLFPDDGYEAHRPRRIKKDIDWHPHHLAICDSRRKNGHRFTPEDKKAELESFLIARKP